MRGFSLLSTVLASAVLCHPTALAATYRTVVIFGDTQNLVDGPIDRDGDPLHIPNETNAEEYEYFGRMVQWVLDNAELENIDFVLHVGDAIQHGPPLPLDSGCFAAGECSEDCNCGAYEAVPVEWQRFTTQWNKLDGVVPYAIVRGNHDNRGTGDPENPGYREGFAQHYGAVQMSALPHHHASYPGDDDTAHAWIFRLGSERVLVVGLSHKPSLHQTAWARGILNDPELADLPAIVLSHQFFLGLPIRYDKPTPSWEIVEANVERVPLAVWGHIAPGEIDMVDIRGYETLRIRTNWQGADPKFQSLMNLVRFHEGPSGIDEIEVLAFSPIFGLSSYRGTYLPRRPFSLRRGPPRGQVAAPRPR